MQHSGKRLFITGIPASGKTFLADILAEKMNGIAVHLDDFREELIDNPRYKKWVTFYLDRDEEIYLANTTPEKQWDNLVIQSEGLWPAFLEKIESFSQTTKPVIFECVNLLPHLAKRDLPFPGIVLLGNSIQEITTRNKQDPRWGETLHLQELEAKTFFEVERPQYKEEAEKYGYPSFEETGEKVLSYCMQLLS